jgi:hypothetical protein
MTLVRRELRWRLRRGKHWLDLVEERQADDRPVYIGLIDGREATRSGDRHLAGSGLIHAGRAAKPSPRRGGYVMG